MNKFFSFFFLFFFFFCRRQSSYFLPFCLIDPPPVRQSSTGSAVTAVMFLRKPVVLLLLLLDILILFAEAKFECDNHETTAFVRITRARLDGVPVVVSTAGHDLTCAQYCRNNIEPTTGAQRACASFNFDGRETCYFFDDAASPAGNSKLASNPAANNFYYEKTCLPGVTAHEACTYRSFSFERMRKTFLEGFVKKSMQVIVFVSFFFFTFFV